MIKIRSSSMEGRYLTSTAGLIMLDWIFDFEGVARLSPRAIDLSTLDWQLGMVARQPFGPAPRDDRGEVREWLPARVPGDIRADLIAAGHIQPVDTPEGVTSSAWVDGNDWWYRSTLPADLPENQLIVLEADGIDYFSAIWLDHTLLATHEGMFARQSVLLPLDAGRSAHELAIRVWGGGALPHNSWTRRLRGRILDAVNPGLQHFSERMATPKAQFGFGWDFAPRLLSTGIWDDVRLVLAKGVYVKDLWAYGEPLSKSMDSGPVRWHIHLRVTRFDRRAVRAEVKISSANFEAAGYERLIHSLKPRSDGPYPYTDDYAIELDMAQARRWWPWDQGEPCLYRVRVILRDAAGHELDSAEQLAGARSVRREALPGGARWRFVINDRPVFLRGANWVPADILPGRVMPADYTRLLGQARAAGINFVRVWGGGVREKTAFWDICDRLGLVAWQEFPLACDFFDRYSSDARYLATLASEVRGTIRALRGHPSLLAWCGGNELDTEREALPLRVIAEQVARHDPTRPWIPASPSAGDVHAWHVWHGLAPWASLAATEAPFMSEFGMQAPPVAATLAEMFPDGVPGSWRDGRWRARKAQVDKLLHYTPRSRQAPLEAIEMMQRVQANALQVGLEACRLRRAVCGGVALWQLNEPWPAVSWAIIDHAGRPKAAYAAVQRSFQSLLIAARFPWRAYAGDESFAAEIWAVNDSPAPQFECRVDVELDGESVFTRSGVDLPAATAFQIGDLRCNLAGAPQAMTLRLSGRDAAQGTESILAFNCYDLAVPLPAHPPILTRLTRWLAARLLKTG